MFYAPDEMKINQMSLRRKDEKPFFTTAECFILSEFCVTPPPTKIHDIVISATVYKKKSGDVNKQSSVYFFNLFQMFGKILV